MYYLCSENKGADQLLGYREAGLRFAYANCCFFDGGGSNICYNMLCNILQAKKSDQYETRDEQAALDYYKMMKKKGLPETSDVGDDDDDGNDDDGLDDDNDVEGAVQGDLDEEGNEETMDGKRAINYQVLLGAFQLRQ